MEPMAHALSQVSNQIVSHWFHNVILQHNNGDRFLLAACLRVLVGGAIHKAAAAEHPCKFLLWALLIFHEAATHRRLL